MRAGLLSQVRAASGASIHDWLATQEAEELNMPALEQREQGMLVPMPGPWTSQACKRMQAHALAP